MDNYISVIKKYAVFDGRAGRKEYWMFFLFNIIISIILSIFSSIIGDDLGILGGLYSLALLIPGIAVGIRRLHDINKCGWWILLCLIPIIGWIWLIVLYAKDGDAGDNQYGPSPKGNAGTPTTPPPTPSTFTTTPVA